MLPGIIEEYLYLEPKECKSVLFVDYIREWLIRKKADVQLSTWEGYEIYVTRHIIPYFEPLGLNIDQVTPKHIQDYYESRLNCQRPDHKAGGLKPVSIKKHAPVLNQIFEAALIEELVLRNPVSVVPLPKQEKREPVGKFMTAEEAGRMLDAFEGHELQALIYVTLYYGLRRSEVLGLKWDAVDFESDTLKIQHTVVKQKTIIAKDSTKSMTSRRVYPLLKEVKKLLLDLREKQKKDRIDFGSAYTETDYIFVWSDGKPYRPDYITRTFKKVLAQHGLPQMRFHDIRHPYVKHTTKIFSLRLIFSQAQPVPDALRKTRGAFLYLREGGNHNPFLRSCNRKLSSWSTPQSKMSLILYAISMRLSGYTSTLSMRRSVSSAVSPSELKTALAASCRLSCRACSSCFCFACANTTA